MDRDKQVDLVKLITWPESKESTTDRKVARHIYLKVSELTKDNTDRKIAEQVLQLFDDNLLTGRELDKLLTRAHDVIEIVLENRS